MSNFKKDIENVHFDSFWGISLLDSPPNTQWGEVLVLVGDLFWGAYCCWSTSASRAKNSNDSGNQMCCTHGQGRRGISTSQSFQGKEGCPLARNCNLTGLQKP